MAQFFSNETVSLEKKVDISYDVSNIEWSTSEQDIDIKTCLNWIETNKFKTVCLQFPDHLLKFSADFVLKLNTSLGRHVYLMADTTYESCCVDYVTAAHINADAVIHFGLKCFTESSEQLPCLYIPPRKPLDVEKLLEACNNFTNDEDSLLYLDVEYAYLKDEIQNRSNYFGRNCLVRTVIEDKYVPEEYINSKCIFVGSNERRIMVFYFMNSVSNLYAYNPNKGVISIFTQPTRILARRSYLKEKIKDSKTIGIVVGTVAVKKYIEVIDRMKKLLMLNGKKYYVIYVGKPTVAKLANFPEIDTYVIVTCPMSEIFEDRDFYQTIVSPFDLEQALNTSESSREHFNSNFTDLTSQDINEEVVKKNSLVHDVSLLTGKIRNNDTEDVIENTDSKNELVQKSDGALALSSNFGAGFLSRRSWKGLEQNLGQTEVCLAQKGRSGIAQGYLNEKSE